MCLGAVQAVASSEGDRGGRKAGDEHGEANRSRLIEGSRRSQLIKPTESAKVF
jgi:hypothetical protein